LIDWLTYRNNLAYKNCTVINRPDET